MTELAQRGHVYEFVEKDGITVKNRVLVVSADSRAGDKLISILMLGDIGFGHDVVKSASSTSTADALLTVAGTASEG